MKNISNMPLTNCYCGQKEDNTLNMLECIKCRRWFHEACTKCLDLPMLLGDRFYIFVCKVCNAGSECLGRLELKWQEITHLLLYNLTVSEKKKYFHLDDTLVPFLDENWERFHIFGPVASEKKNIRDKLLHNLESCHSRFKCGKEVKKCKSIWALRVRVPPDAPDVLPSAPRLEKDIVVWDFQVKDRAYHIITYKKFTKNKEHCKNGKHKAKLNSTSSSRQKNGEVSKCRGSLSHNENGIKAKHKSKRTTAVFNEDSARFGLLDSFIPLPSNFSKMNNPFQNSSNISNLECPGSQNQKAVGRARKRRQNSESYFDMTVANGNLQHYGESCSESTLLTSKDSSLQKSKADFCIVGKRTSSSGKIQYLLQRNRAKMEEAVAEKEPLFQITFICNCCYCKCYHIDMSHTDGHQLKIFKACSGSPKT